ncbi:serine/threonine-protein kinase [Streptomyces sp. H27-C3]|uniref:serine/threonine-protein kinase n=1 Tax=Streptomyces sp. H27-C3 TaxID=3046305 RepID=UPI0024BB8160|nr:serine/threonine-protein kinase [Streptomyces sp. H27-C3]MDJ0461457.1 serine/threonine-protein kinase [Streptomyces sp. H27-C3]
MEILGPEDPQQIGAYRLLARLGAGGMGQVFLARSGRGRTVAVKLVRQELAEQEEFRSRFRQEVAAARRVGGRWTAPVLDADTEATIPWVATGYVAGPSLQSVVSAGSGSAAGGGAAAGHGPLPERSVHILGAGLAHALKDIHGAGLIHRDLKPSNVLITIDGPRVIDFGIARALETVTDAGLTRAGALVGSPGFMAPEQVRGEPITPACDIFCLGSVLAYASTGRLPFGTADSGVHALMFRIATQPPELGDVPEGLRDLIGDCLLQDPTARPTPEQILERTRGADGEPWLPGALVAQLGNHAIQLLELESEGPAPGSENGAAPAAPPGGGVHALPTIITAPTPPPTAGPNASGPPAPPALAPTPPYASYSYPQPQQPHPHHTPPSGYGPHGPLYAYQPTTPEPAPRTGRSTAALITVALLVALGAGGSVYAFMNTGEDEQHSGPVNTLPTVSANGPTDDGKNTAPPPSPNGSPTQATKGGSIPEEYLGAWSGTIGDTGQDTRRIVLQQGEIGDTVLSLTADGPLAVGTYHCVFQAELTAPPSGGAPLKIGPSRVTAGEPMASCEPGKPTELTLEPDGTLRRTTTATGESVTYTKSG